MSDNRLLRHLVTAMLVKLLALAAIWWCFVRDARVGIDTDATSRHVAAAAAAPSPAGERP